MDYIEPVVLTAAQLLATKTLDAAGEQVGQELWDRIRSLTQRVRRRMDDEEQLALLERVTGGSAGDGEVEALAEVLQGLVVEDPAFRTELDESVEAAEPVFRTRVSGRARVGKLVNIQHAGDVSF